MYSGTITSWELDVATVETVTEFIFLGSKTSADGDCSHEIKGSFLHGSIVMTSLDSILKSRDSVGGGWVIWENGNETCKTSYRKRIASPVSLHDTGCLGLVHWDDPEGWYGEGGGRSGGCRGVPLELQRGSQGLACIASEKSGLFSSFEGPVGIPLESLPVNRAVSRVQNPLPSSLPVPSLWIVPVHQPQASCILHRTWTGDSFLI